MLFLDRVPIIVQSGVDVRDEATLKNKALFEGVTQVGSRRSYRVWIEWLLQIPVRKGEMV